MAAFFWEVSERLQILVVSDGKPGHENQSLGLAEAMGRRVVADVHLLKLDMGKGMIGRMRAALVDSVDFPKPDYVIGAGHGTHLPLLRVAGKYGASSICLMRPSLPMGWFTWCVVPGHDFRKPRVAKNLIVSKGAPNRVVRGTGERKGKLLLIGGPSKIHGYDEKRLVGRIREIVVGDGWGVADSRRTPETFLPALMEALPGVEVFPHVEMEKGWLARKLGEVEEVWVTEDSVSMIYEALSSGARVRVLEMPRLRADARVIRGLELLKEEGYFDEGSEKVLAETERCAGLILGGP
ncbi:MAG: mitochondrial fission ELM1 family protein [Luteolibacter sp.]